MCFGVVRALITLYCKLTPEFSSEQIN